MSNSSVAKISNEIEMLSYSDRMFLLEKILKTFSFPTKKTISTSSADFENAFGIWKDNDISLKEIRKKAWSRS